jgi:hypothetical protein
VISSKTSGATGLRVRPHSSNGIFEGIDLVDYLEGAGSRFRCPWLAAYASRKSDYRGRG